MKLTVPANYDRKIVADLANYPVRDVYGQFPLAGVGGKQPEYMGTRLSQGDVREYVCDLAEHGIAFNYMLDGSRLGGRECSWRFQRKFLSLLATLREWGVARLTVSRPFLLEVIKERFPRFHVDVGISAQVNTVNRRDSGKTWGQTRLVWRAFPSIATSGGWRQSARPSRASCS